MRRSVVIASLAALLVAVAPAAVSAAAPTRLSGTSVFIECAVVSDDGAFVSLFAGSGTLFGSFVELALWSPGDDPGETPPLAYGFDEAGVSGDASGLAGSIELFRQDTDTPDAYGTATFDVSFSPFGEPEPIDERSDFGNRHERITGTFQALEATGMLDLPGGDQADLGACLASAAELTIFGTNPAGFNLRDSSLEISCFVGTEGDSVSFFAAGFTDGGFADVFIDTEGGPFVGGADAIVSRSQVEASASVSDEDGNEVGSFAVTATVEPTGEVVRFTDRFPGGQTKVVQEILAISGTLEVTIDETTTTYPLDAGTCSGFDGSFHEHSVAPAGPKPGPLANDGPDGAEALRLGRQVRLITGGNEPAAEVPCTFIGEDEEGNPVEGEAPFGYTAWYTVTGTGDELTADTAGSLFDTVLAVYVDGAGGLEQVACVDDVGEPDFSFQARVSWDSDAGTTYWIQVGGFDTQAGRLQLVVE